jgi:hypothetical protein
MKASRAEVDPQMQAWVDEQLKHFKPGDMDGAIRLWRGYERADREADRKHRASAA